MKLTLKLGVAAIILVLGFATPMVAGPLEDADAAIASDRLSAVSVKKLATQRGMHADGNGLYLRVNPEAGQCSWVLRFMLHGKARWMGLGAYPLVSLADARARATDARRLLVDKLDPITARDEKHSAAKLEAAKRVTFAECARAAL